MNPLTKKTVIALIALAILALAAIILSSMKKSEPTSGIDPERAAQIKADLQAPPPTAAKSEAQLKADLNKAPSTQSTGISLEEQERIRAELRE